MPRVGFEPTVAAGERPKTYALDRAATGTGEPFCINNAYEQCKALSRHQYGGWFAIRKGSPSKYTGLVKIMLTLMDCNNHLFPAKCVSGV